jgi:uncharacterized protein YceK
MQLGRGLLAVVLSISCTGCSSAISSWKSRPVAAHKLYPGRMFSLTGERRLAFFVPRSIAGQAYNAATDDTDRTAWCAESLPEASQAITATSKGSLKLPETAEGGLEDSVATSLTQTFTRTEIAEMFRQLGWQTCQAWAQGVFTDEQYRVELAKLVDAGVYVIKKRSDQPINPPPTPAAPAAQGTKPPPAVTGK